MAAPEVSVIMAVRKGAAYVAKAGGGGFFQTMGNLEPIAIDDASTDETPRVLESYRDSRLCLIRNSENLGLAQSLNLGMQRSMAPFIARMDGDDVCAPRRLEKQLYFMKQATEVIVVGSWVYAFGDGTRDRL